ncbi:hypothetical protein ABID19_006842 [Mesorhizobium robiniae]|uniref:Uncharacterized protein n=1 Tax=Mesorhizobium robiniae TaxID=559315 RepID=A0ABV2GZR3_9HYPH
MLLKIKCKMLYIQAFYDMSTFTKLSKNKLNTKYLYAARGLG